MRNRNIINFVLRTGIGLVVLFLVVFLGYLLGGILGYSEIVGYKVPLSAAMAAVFSNPFGDYYNSLTPITIILSVVIGEFIVFLLMLVIKKKSSSDEVSDAVSVEDTGTEETEEEPVNSDGSGIDEESEAHEVKAEDLFNNIFSFEELDEEQGSADPIETKENEDEEDLNIYIAAKNISAAQEHIKEPELDKPEQRSPVLNSLVGYYSNDQINAISKALEYMPDLNEKKIKKMFRQDQSANEIRQYIEILFE